MGIPAEDGLSKVFAALADPTRRDMVARLSAGDATVSELADPYDVTIQAVSKHLKVLEEAGLVTRQRDAQRRPAHLETAVFDRMTHWIARYQKAAEARYRRLDDVLLHMAEPVLSQPDETPSERADASEAKRPTQPKTNHPKNEQSKNEQSKNEQSKNQQSKNQRSKNQRSKNKGKPDA